MNRNNKLVVLWLVIFAPIVCSAENKKSPSNVPYQPKFELLKVGDVKVDGWMLEQMNTDLTVGYLSHFQDICGYIDQDVVNAKRVTTDQRYPDYPHLGNWWGAEEEYYLKDGMLRMAIQSDNQEILKRAKSWMERILAYQGEDGYLGMYVAGEEVGTRFNHAADNGELWVQSRMMSAMLSWYEYTGDKRFLVAVEKAVKLDASHYMKRNYFEKARGIKGSGITHSVGFFDILEWLIRLTGDPLYVDFSKKFYEDFNAVPTRNNEMSTDKLLDEDLKFQDHTPHIVEGAYMQCLYAALTHNKNAYTASANAIKKINYHLTPGGGVVGDEDVRGQQGTVDAYREYCALAELVFSLNRVISISGDVLVGDMVERTVFNAAQGARLPDLTALEYLSSDNRLHINGCEHAGRLAYDANRALCKNGKVVKPFSQEAVCCVTSAARILPYYIDGMWMKTTDRLGLAAMYYGPTTASVTLNGIDVTIKEITNYPFSDEISFQISTSKPLNFDLMLRIPEGADDILICNDVKADVTKSENFVSLNRKWKDGDIVKISFPFKVKKIAQPVSRTVPRPGYLLQRGPLVFSLEFPYELEKSLEYNHTGYYRYEVHTLSETGWDYSIDEKEDFSLVKNEKANFNKPWFKSPISLEGKLVDKNGVYHEVSLVPEGCTVLRRVAFPCSQR